MSFSRSSFILVPLSFCALVVLLRIFIVEPMPTGESPMPGSAFQYISLLGAVYSVFRVNARAAAGSVLKLYQEMLFALAITEFGFLLTVFLGRYRPAMDSSMVITIVVMVYVAVRANLVLRSIP